MQKGRTKVLFVCVGNTCRSQMAEGFARTYGTKTFEVLSAGTSAMGTVNKSTVETMKEVGIDISAQQSKQLTMEMIEWADVVVTLGCCAAEDICPPSYEGKKYDWKTDDPLGKPAEIMRRVRDSIEKNVKELISAQS